VVAEAAAIDAISQQWLQFALARDAAGIAGLFASDGELYSENEESIVGPAAIEAFQTRNFERDPDAVPAFGSDRIEVASSGDLAVEFGSWGPEGADSDFGKYVTVYRKVEGVWRVVGDMALSSKPEESSGN
jgi:ketosteroid isomerase-like protein